MLAKLLLVLSCLESVNGLLDSSQDATTSQRLDDIVREIQDLKQEVSVLKCKNPEVL